LLSLSFWILWQIKVFLPCCLRFWTVIIQDTSIDFSICLSSHCVWALIFLLGQTNFQFVGCSMIIVWGLLALWAESWDDLHLTPFKSLCLFTLVSAVWSSSVLMALMNCWNHGW
jgi:hypothetical protein